MVAQQPDVTGLSNQYIFFVFTVVCSIKKAKFKAFIKQLLHDGRKTNPQACKSIQCSDDVQRKHKTTVCADVCNLCQKN